VAELETSTLSVAGAGTDGSSWAEKGELCGEYLWGPQVRLVRPLRSIST